MEKLVTQKIEKKGNNRKQEGEVQQEKKMMKMKKNGE